MSLVAYAILYTAHHCSDVLRSEVKINEKFPILNFRTALDLIVGFAPSVKRHWDESATQVFCALPESMGTGR